MVAALLPTAIVESVLRDDLVWPTVSAIVCVVLLPTLLWRRSHPLAALAVTFGLITTVDIVSMFIGDQWEGLGTTAFVLLLPYSLFRWGSGRHAVAGLAMIAIPLTLSTIDGESTIGEMIGGVVIILVVAELGAAVRYQDAGRVQELSETKHRERRELARELHDTVAHHVSAIAVQAQAGRTVAADRPEAAVEALRVIEEEASRTLDEMRSIVGALRDERAAETTPLHVVSDIEQLARGAGVGPTITTQLEGELDNLRPSVGAAAYRVAQEGVTNAVRHARFAQHVRVEVTADRDVVHVTVCDDGLAVSPGSTVPGHGLVGMRERVTVLGGEIEAGPGPERGWRVAATLPKRGAAT